MTLPHVLEGPLDASVLVLPSSLGTTVELWETNLPHWAETFRTLRYDQPGLDSVEELGSALLGLLDELGVERASLCGLSLGGAAAMWAAASQPERVDRLVLACTTPGGSGAHPMPQGTVALIALAATLEPDVALRRYVENALAPATPTEHPALVEEILARRLAAPQDPVAWVAQASAGAAFDRFDRMAEIAAVTLVQTGTEDGVVDPRNSELLAEAIPNARLERFAGAGHLFFWEQPEAFVESVTRFLEDRGR
jgi:3-oxoadipate enol-lactonase